jgi:methylmalonyl-CoA/ethylmalonyl-CoA epimerase
MPASLLGPLGLLVSASGSACPHSWRVIVVSRPPRIAHIGLAVTSIDDALPFYREILGLEPRGPAEERDGARIVCLPFGESDVELLEPVTPDGPIAKFLARRGPGIHHVCYRVADLDAALAAAAARGLELVDTTPRTGAGGHRIAFLHPRSTSGVLVELTE